MSTYRSITIYEVGNRKDTYHDARVEVGGDAGDRLIVYKQTTEPTRTPELESVGEEVVGIHFLDNVYRMTSDAPEPVTIGDTETVVTADDRIQALIESAQALVEETSWIHDDSMPMRVPTQDAAAARSWVKDALYALNPATTE